MFDKHSYMKQQFKVIHIELETPYRGKKHYYYGSKAAIYQHLPEEIVGIKLESLWNVDLDQEEYKNRLCTIRMGTLRRKSTARGGKVPEQNDDIGIIAKNMANNIIMERAGKYIEQIEDELKSSGDVGKAKEIMDKMMEQVSQDVDILKDVLKKE